MHLVLCQFAGKEMLVFGKWFSALLLTSRFNFLWSNGIFLREFRAGKKPSYTRADRLSFLSCLPKLTGVMPPCTQHDAFCWPCRHFRRRHSSAWFAPWWLIALSDHWCLWWELFCLLCTAESIWQVTDPEKPCIPLEMFYARKVDWFLV